MTQICDRASHVTVVKPICSIGYGTKFSLVLGITKKKSYEVKNSSDPKYSILNYHNRKFIYFHF